MAQQTIFHNRALRFQVVNCVMLHVRCLMAIYVIKLL